MSNLERAPGIVVRAADIAQRSMRFSHPWNPLSEVSFTHLSGEAGLTRTGVSLVRLDPGKESFAYHSHECEEEWIYVLSGRGVADIDDQDHEVGAGDFLAFPTPSVAHNMKNPFEEPLVYLMGGESRELDIADFPRLGKRMLRRGRSFEVVPLADVEEVTFPSPEPLAESDSEGARGDD